MDYFIQEENVFPETGDLLLSEPFLPDGNFERAVILLCSHDENGSFGFVLNKITDTAVGDLLNKDNESLQVPVFIGGPVQQNTLFVLHRDYNFLRQGQSIIQDVFWGGDYSFIELLLQKDSLPLDRYRFLVGYSGWSQGQLKEEINQKSWIVLKRPSVELLFSTPPDLLWRTLLSKKGGKYKAIANYPLDPNLN